MSAPAAGRPRKAPPIPPHPKLQVRSDEVPWAGRFPVQRVVFTYTRFDGTPSRELTWELWRRGNGVIVVPYDPAADAVALIEQFRLPALAAGYDPIVTECPAGLLEPDEDPELAVRRETREETGLTPDRYEKIGAFMLMHGGCDEVLHFYVARVTLPERAPDGTHGLVNEGEDIRVTVVPALEAFAMVDDNRIANAPAALCLLWLRAHRDRLRRQWMEPA